ncbi:hypothetical protein GF362_04795 [Candidatus Dojkabacteria bacterium]|nr:hypothetical protein [Candidatus Dojkabacteria bacterium]
MQEDETRWFSVIPEGGSIFTDPDGGRHYYSTTLEGRSTAPYILPSVVWCNRIPVSPDDKFYQGVEVVDPETCPARTEDNRCRACGVFKVSDHVDNAVPALCIVNTPEELRRRPQVGICLTNDIHRAALRSALGPE